MSKIPCFLVLNNQRHKATPLNRMRFVQKKRSKHLYIECGYDALLKSELIGPIKSARYSSRDDCVVIEDMWQQEHRFLCFYRYGDEAAPEQCEKLLRGIARKVRTKVQASSRISGGLHH